MSIEILSHLFLVTFWRNKMVSQPLYRVTQFEEACGKSKINLFSRPYFVTWLLFSVL